MSFTTLGVILVVSGITSFISIAISFVAIYLQASNYRKPFEQRLIIRILIIVPLFAVSCYVNLISPSLGKYVEPFREFYEALVIYTFYKLLVLMLGGERQIIQDSIDKPKTKHPRFINMFLSPVEFSDPSQFLFIKRCILQYVWVKPLLYLVFVIGSLVGVYDETDISLTSLYFWTGVAYNLSVTISLYFLAMFWKCLYEELRQFNPWGKFLCVKLIIFASYWQGLLLGVLSWFGVLKPDFDENPSSFLSGMQIQNALLCLEMIFFAILHWRSFPYTDFTADRHENCARISTPLALKDCLFLGDLFYDLKITTLYGDSYNFRNFDSINDNRIYTNSGSFNQKIHDGLRYSSDGKKYWLPDNRTSKGVRRTGSSGSSSKSLRGHSNFVNQYTPLLTTMRSTYIANASESLVEEEEEEDVLNFENLDSEFARDEVLYKLVKSKYISPKLINYPVVFDHRSTTSANRLAKLRQQLDYERVSRKSTLSGQVTTEP
ncbi:hypothetical protein OGAPHI_006426 [Ogataea philodendri]|uniref:DUF300-domain-containing protein n=1 Tax=Ogataea philodendri TaxID=1378263 RepID=A0A9P8T0A7_9ASCO|nr:uncharacterized protein OGAPHI_006426 [Ogataea philodendri]KAH3661578.1 hypothetical protein OGAPHI_006426 [Ogataea philodendri]